MKKTMRKTTFTGLEPAKDFWGKKLYENNYVTVFSVTELPPQVSKDIFTGKNKTTHPTKFTYTVNFHGFPVDNMSSTLRFQSVIIDVEGKISSDLDIKRLIRQFEFDANDFMRRTRAKKPNFQAQFAKIDMKKVRWKRWFPTTKSSI